MQVNPSHRQRFSSAFSLIELSVVMAILSIVAVCGLEAAGAFMSRTAYQTTQEKLAVIKGALTQYRKVYGHLPCPANTALTASNSSYGKEVRTAGVCTSGTLTGSIFYGDLPVRDLNLPLSYMKDGYTNKLRYFVSNALTTTAAFMNTANMGDIPIRTGRLEQEAGGCSTMCQQIALAAYAVVSFGADKRDGWTTSCINSNTAYDGMIDSANCRLSTVASEDLKMNGSNALTSPPIPLGTLYDSRYNNGSVEQNHFDDLLVWQTKGQL